MALIKTSEQKEIEALQKVENEIRRRERRDRIHHLICAGLGLLAIAAFVGGHCTGRHCEKKRHII